VSYLEGLVRGRLDAVGVVGSIQPDEGQGDGGAAVRLEHACPRADLVISLHGPHNLGGGEVVEAPISALPAQATGWVLAAYPPAKGGVR